MTQWKKTVKKGAKIDAQMPECFALLSRLSFEHNIVHVPSGAGENVVCSMMLRRLETELRGAAAYSSATEKRHSIYEAISCLMLMLSKIEGRLNDAEEAEK